MKKPSFLIAFLLCAQLCIAQAVKNSLSIEHLKGKVKRVESSSFRDGPVDGKIDTLAPHDTFIDLYDENGNATEDSYFGKDGLLISKFTKRYNGKGEETEESYYRKDMLDFTTFFKYDQRGNVI